MTEPLVLAQHVERIFDLGSEHIRAVHDVDLEVNSGQLMMITGRSGSGKTTLLNLLGGLDTPTSGTVSFQGQELSKLSESELNELRRHRIGFVFQSFNLLPRFSALANVELGMRYAGGIDRQRAREARIVSTIAEDA